MFWCSTLLYVPLYRNCCMFCQNGFPMSACSFSCKCYCGIYFDCCTYSDTGALHGLYTGVCLECGDPGNWSPWFPMTDLGLLFLRVYIDLLVCLGCGIFKNGGVPVTLAILVIGHQCRVMKEFVIPSCPVLTTSRGFVVGLGRLSGIAFIINAGEVGLGCLL